MEEENVYSLSQSNFTKLSHEKEFGQERLIVESNNFSSLYQSGGIDSVVAALESDLGRGISGHDEDLRRRYAMFGSNHIVEVNSQQLEKRHFLQVILNATKDSTVILFLFCALLSFVLEIKSNGLEEGLIDGLMIFVVIFTASTFSQVVKFLQNRRNEKLVRTKKAAVTVKRDGRERQISISEVVVGDIVCLKTGDEVPGDGLIFHRSDGLKVDDYDDNDHVGDNDFHQVFSGSKVVGGQCSMLVTSVGLNTETRKMIKLLKGDLNEEYGGFQIEHDMMIFRLDKIWLSLSLLVLVVQVLRCFIKKIGCRDCQHLDPKGVKDTAGEIMTKATNIIKRQGRRLNLFVQMIAVLIFAVRDGLPLGLLISFAYASKQFKRYRGIVQHLPACGTLGFVTTICTDITGDLFLEDAKMADFWIGTDIIGESILNCVNTDVLDALGLGICMNSSSVSVDDELLYWAKEVLGFDREVIKQNWTIEASEVQNNRTGLLLRWNGEDGSSYVNIHWKGAPDIILSMCTHYFDIDGTLQTLDEHKRDVFKKNIEYIRANSVQCIAFAWKKVEEHEEEIVELADDPLTLLAIVGLKNPYPPEVKQAIEACGELGFDIKLIVGNDTNTARLIAIISGILKPEEDTNEAAVVEASEFRNNYEAGGSIMANNIRALANASPSDKLLMVQCLKEKGEVVAVTGMSTRDSPALKEANVGLLLGDRRPEIAKQNSDIIILDKKFATVVDMLKLGKCMGKTSKKIIQLQLTLNITSFTVNLIAAVLFDEVPLPPFQLLWANLVVDVLGALALGRPTGLSVDGASSSSLSKTKLIMRRNIMIQVMYQVTFFLAIQFKGKKFLHASQKVIEGIVFNTLVLCQPFVLLNAKEIEKPNIFQGMTLHESRWFLITVGAISILQVGIIEVITAVSNGERLNIENWCACIGIAAMSMPVGLVCRVDVVAVTIFFFFL